MVCFDEDGRRSRRTFITEDDALEFLDKFNTDALWPPGPDGTFVYFIQMGEDGPIKIGHSRDVGRRLKSMQTSCPALLRLLGTIAGAQECLVHVRFHHLRIAGEWFRAEPDLLDFITQKAGLQ